MENFTKTRGTAPAPHSACMQMITPEDVAALLALPDGPSATPEEPYPDEAPGRGPVAVGGRLCHPDAPDPDCRRCQVWESIAARSRKNAPAASL